MIEETLVRIADALELLTTQNAQLLGSVKPAEAEPEPAKPAGKGKTGAGKVATPKAAEEPATPALTVVEPEPEPEPAEAETTLDDVKAAFLQAQKADKAGADAAFEAYKTETGTTKVSALSSEQRAELVSRFEAVIAASEM